MNTFPYDSWDEALVEPAGYFTWGPGGNTGSVVLAILGIALATLWLAWLVVHENRHLSSAASRLDAKWDA